MTNQQQRNLNEVVFSMQVEGFNIPNDERQTLIDILDGKRTYKEVLDGYIAEAKAYAKV